MRRTVGALGGVAAGLLAAVACEPWDPPQREQTFVLDGAHALAACESCHGPPPFGDLPSDCNSCHVDTDMPCDADEVRPECHYYRDVPLTGTVQQCNLCHTTTDWVPFAGGCDQPSPHGPAYFPLEGSHAQGCGTCHDTEADPACDDLLEATCGDCHEALRHQVFNPHYEDPVTDWPAFPATADGTKWDCEACHFVGLADGVDRAWKDRRREHAPDGVESVFKYPHGVANDADLPPDPAADGRVPTAIENVDYWVTDCGDCHPTAPTDGAPATEDNAPYQVYECDIACHQGDIWDTHEHIQGSTITEDALDNALECKRCHPAGRLQDDQHEPPL